MKKRIIAILCFCLLLGLCACEKADQTPAVTLQVGFGRADLTPDFKMPLQGYPGPQNRIFARVLDPIYATCIAFADGENTVLLFTLDMTGSCWDAVAFAKTDIQNELGIPFGNIMVSCTHNHSSPSLVESPNRERYVALMRSQLLAAARDALADLKNATMYTASVQAEGLNAVRHYTLSDGSVCGDNFGDTEGKSYTGHVGKPDQQLQVLRFVREGGKDVVMTNWQAHPHITGGEMRLDLSADIVAPMRTYVEENADCLFAYFTGASGNLNSRSRIPGENSALNYVDHGTELGQYTCLALTDMTPAATGKVQLTLEKHAPVEKNSGKRTVQVSMNAFSIGDVGFAVVPYEMFSPSGEFIKENSPFQATFVVTCANGDGGYMPTENMYEYNGQESYEGSLCPYVKGTAEELAQKYVELLTALHSTRAVGAAPALKASRLYWNVDGGTRRSPNADGTYTARFVCDGQLLELTVPGELMAAIDLQDLVGLTVEGSAVKAFTPLSELPESLLCRDYCVQSMGGSTVKVNANDRLTGKEQVLKLKDIPIYNVSTTAAVPGEASELQKGDLVTAVNDADGKLTAVYISGREGIYTTCKRYCDHCDGEVEFLNWFRSNALPTIGGHYYLEKDITLSKTQILSAANVTLDLNGKTVTQTGFGEGIYWMREDSRLTIIDSAGTGKLIPASTEDDINLTIWKGLCVRMETGAVELNIYGGTFDGSAATAQHCTTVDNMTGTMNIYGGTFIGGSTYGAGGATIMAQDRANIYGGTFQGGHSAVTSYVTDAVKGGGNLYVAGTGVLSIYGGTFQGGTAEGNGGNVLCYGTLRLYGGTFEGGAADGLGDTLYVSANATVEFNGQVSVTGECLIDAEATLTVADDCGNTVRRTADGKLHIK